VNKFKNNDARINSSAVEKIFSPVNIPALILRAIADKRDILAKNISSLYLIVIAPLVILDGKFTALGIKAGYYEGELNPLINYLFGYFEIDTVFWLRALFILFAVAFLAYAYHKYPRCLKKYYLLLVVSVISYLSINIVHVWVLYQL
jgi:formate hydrogenlyase subunit 3/multisubunit Na+/H+ antiporter MnhD subunit